MQILVDVEDCEPQFALEVTDPLLIRRKIANGEDPYEIHIELYMCIHWTKEDIAVCFNGHEPAKGELEDEARNIQMKPSTARALGDALIRAADELERHELPKYKRKR